MNESRQNIEAARMRRRIENMINQSNLKTFNIQDLQRDRNERAGYQVRSFAQQNQFATFGGGGPPIVGP